VHELADIAVQLEELVGPPDGPAVPLEGGITNRNLLVTARGERYVVRRPGKDTELLGIDRAAEVEANRAAAALGIAPAVIGMAGECLVTRFVPSRGLREGELASRAAELGAHLRRFHACGAAVTAVFDVGVLLDDYAVLATEHGAVTGEDYEFARTTMRRIDAALGERDRVPCHNDLLAGNLIVTDEDRLMIVDWEYAGRGDGLFDLGNAVVNNELDAAAAQRLLTGYDGTPPDECRLAQLALMKVASDAREAAWGVVQGCLSELDFDFAGYAAQHFARLRASVEDPSFEHALQIAATLWEDPRHGLQAT
jgi:thiamine kinase-like enzyme